ncbi:MAG: hypothetical protein MUC50_11045 [Myxococcota bacterium]|jgi:hypothetical protein|nr:hypothetical protein [Myxococcota bacterium]
MSSNAVASVLLLSVGLFASVATARPLTVDLEPKRTEAVPDAASQALGRPVLPTFWSAPAPAAFLARNGGSWVHRISGPTQDFRTIYGSGVPVDPASISEPVAAVVSVLEFFDENPELLPEGVTTKNLKVVSNVLFDGMRFVALRQTIDGAPVVGTAVTAAMIAGRLVLASVKAYPVANPSSRLFPKVILSQAKLHGLAIKFAEDLGIRAVTVTSSEAAVLPLALPGGLVLRPVTRLEMNAPFSRFTSFLDPRSGEIVALRDNKQFFEGTLMLRHHERNPDPNVELVESAAQNLLVQMGKQNAYTDAMGVFVSDSADPVSAFTAQLSGKYVDVRNAAGAELELAVSSATALSSGMTYTIADTDEFDMAQVDAFAFTTIVREFAKSLAFKDLAFFNTPIRVNVNVSVDLGSDNQPDFCNAYYDGQSLNFLPEGSMYGAYLCNNTAMIADILYHEYGHALHYHSSLTGEGSFDEAVSEGFSDTMATALTGDSVLGRFFIKTGQGIRNMKNDLIWPNDQSQDPHQTGLILAGAIWDLRETFQAKLGQEAGDALTNSMFGSAMATSTDILSVFESFLLADDDNGNLSDGTPHFCDVFGAFARHGLASEDLGRITITHTPLANLVPSKEPVVIEADIAEGAEDCSTLGEVSVVYSVDEGSTWKTVAASSLGGESYRAALPAVAARSRLLYRIEAADADNGLVTKRPSNATEPYYIVYVGALTPIAFDDFEEEDGAWSHELISGRERETSDDWARGKPRGDGGDPGTAYSGNYVWGNDLRPKITWDGQYDGGIHNALSSPAYDLSAYDNVRLQFRRWLTVEDGYFDKARISINGEEVWANTVSAGGEQDNHTTHHIDKEWVLFDLDISQQAAGQSDIRIRFELESDRGLQMGGWNLDDFALYTASGSEPQTDSDTEPDSIDTGDEMDGDAEGAINAMSGGCGCTSTGSHSFGTSLFGALLALW